MTPLDKLTAMQRGQAVITNDAELNAMLVSGNDAIKLVRSLPNPKRIGLRDQYIAWISDSMTPPEVSE